MKAMLFAAGIGSRLKPLTDHRPKALVEFKGEPLINGVIRKLTSAGVTEIVVNLHHFADKLRDYLMQQDFNVKIQYSDETEFLLDTGGGLKKAAKYFNDNQPFLVCNVDILSDIDLLKLYNQHIENKSLATLAVRNRKTSRYLLFDNNKELCGWENISTNELKLVKGSRTDLEALAFSGVQVVDPKIFSLLTEEGKFSIIDAYLRLSKSEKVMAYIHNDDYWFDLGTVKQLQEAEAFLK
ncbi:MAG: nucleotidyltransferase family protein [Bacteroidetes bacterium]|nr:nucleotidyltransferase family protein [Bacteroidota bacterium]